MSKEPEKNSNESGQQPRDIVSLAKNEVIKLTDMGIYNPRVSPALTLYAYNFFRMHENPSESDTQDFLDTCLHINQAEEDARNNPFTICTVGVEAEWFVKPELRAVLQQLGIKTIPANDEDPTDPLWEIDFPWTYSAETQAFMRDQMDQMGVFDTPDDIDPLPALRIGLHINEGIPEDIPQEIIERPESEAALYDMVDALILAYTSPERLAERKTFATFTNDKETDVSQAFETASIQYRLEFRAHEMTAESFRELIHSAQNLGIGYFQWVRSNILRKTQDITRQIADQYQSFSFLMDELREQYDILPDFASIKVTEQAIAMVSQQDVVAKVRMLVQETSNTIEVIVGQR